MCSLNLDTPSGQRWKRKLRAPRAGAMHQAQCEFGEYMTSKLTRRLIGPSPAAAGDPPGSRRGTLARSIHYGFIGDLLAVGSGLRKYPSKLHWGGEIHAPPGKALAIPIASEAEGKRPRDFPDLFIIKSRHGVEGLIGILARVIGRRPPKLQPMFALRSMVTLKPHPWVYWDGADANKFWSILKRIVNGAG